MPYTYLWLREDGTPYYIGKGKGNRAFYRYSRKIQQPPTLDRIIVQEFDSEEDAFEAEKFLIALFGRKDIGTGILYNYTDGGEGPSGTLRAPYSVDRIQKMREASLGVKFTEERKNKISTALKGKKKSPFSEEHKRKIGEANSRRKYSAEHNEKMREVARRRWSNVS